MKRLLKSFLLPAAAAMAALLLAGCQGTQEKHKAPATTQVEAQIDTTETDTMEAFYERMRTFDALYPSMPSEK
jgi:outer membrane murein-binding lipoprotein Lpp